MYFSLTLFINSSTFLYQALSVNQTLFKVINRIDEKHPEKQNQTTSQRRSFDEKNKEVSGSLGLYIRSTIGKTYFYPTFLRNQG